MNSAIHMSYKAYREPGSSCVLSEIKKEADIPTTPEVVFRHKLSVSFRTKQ